MLHQLPKWANASKYYGSLTPTTGRLDVSRAIASASRWLALRCGAVGSGLQATIALDDHAGRQIGIDQILGDPILLTPSERGLRDEVSALFFSRFAFPLGLERFSSMLLSSALAASAQDGIRSIAQAHLTSFVGTDTRGLYGFFAAPAFAGDIDCTAAATKARLLTGDIDVETEKGRAELKRLVDVIFESAATQDLAAEHNQSHGKTNGALFRYVFKVYLDNHDRHGPETDRGLKNNPVVVAQALYPVLVAIASGIYGLDDPVDLKEFCEGAVTPHVATASVGAIVAANITYVMRHLESSDFMAGCRYYRSPDVFLYFLSEAARDFPTAFDGHDVRGLVARGAAARRAYEGSDAALSPHSSLNSALRAIALLNLGNEADAEIQRLLSRQLNQGCWGDFDVLYGLGESSRVVFRSDVLTTAFCLKALEQQATLRKG